MKIKTVLLLLLIFTLITTNSKAQSNINYKYIDREAWVPLDFDPVNTVLLIEKSKFYNESKKKHDKRIMQLEDVMKKNYPYAYKLIERTDSDTSYNDFKMYPYMIIFKSEFHEFSNSSRHIASGSTGQLCRLLYRKNGAIVSTNFWSFSYQKGVLEATIKQLLNIYNKRNKK